MEDISKELIVIITGDGYELDWQDLNKPLDSRPFESQKFLYKSYRNNPEKFLYFFAFTANTLNTSDSLRFLHQVVRSFIKVLSKNPDIEFIREKVIVRPDIDEIQHILADAPFMIGSQYLDENWINLIFTKMNQVFSSEITIYQGSVSDYFSSKSSEIHLVGKVFFHLVENKGNDYPFAFMATYSSGVDKGGRSKHLPLKNALLEFENDNPKLLELLSTVNRASYNSRFISELVNSGEIFHPIGLTGDEAYTFLKEVPLYEDSGILCRIPNWWKKKSNSIKLNISLGDNVPSKLGFEALVNFDARLSLGGEPITSEEISNLLMQSEGLAFIKGKWVEVNHERLNETLEAYKQAQKAVKGDTMSIIEAMRFQINASKMLDISNDELEIEVSNGEWLKTVVNRLAHPENINQVNCGENFNAILRKYQERGLSWLHYMKTLRLGACLADDMGLGKTIQVIALLNHIRGTGHERTLLVIPASLIGNWMNEIDKFAPLLKYHVLHPSENKTPDEAGICIADNNDIVITTYGMLLKFEWLREVNWDIMILDEAQAIKNPGTKQTRAVKQIDAAFRVAMTGTPIENRLSDLWSLFDFLNKGLLGNKNEFTAFNKKLKNNPSGYSQLKKVVGPFILRRLKTDKTIITDLPDKIEMKTFSTLSKKQAALYNDLVNQLKSRLEETGTGMERKGLVLSSLMKFKQICNHPDQYLGQDNYTESESGKYRRLREICETIYEKRERVLVFTQFKEITGYLETFLENIFQHKGLVIHGGTSVSKRKKLVEQFQGHDYVPFLVLSLKAGGVGLNLTAANHVVHFDRWWNPAVENQATDRAFRIGQSKNVIVHKFITKGTIEEKIDLLIEEKTKLTQEIIPEKQENWITEMNNNQLMELFSLSI